MIFVALLTFVGTSFGSRGGPPGLGYSIVRSLMVMPTWWLTASLGWPAAVVGGIGLLVVCAVAASRLPIGEGSETGVNPERLHRHSRRTKAQ
jgi:hypothetical protein